MLLFFSFTAEKFCRFCCKISFSISKLSFSSNHTLFNKPDKHKKPNITNKCWGIDQIVHPARQLWANSLKKTSLTLAYKSKTILRKRYNVIHSYLTLFPPKKRAKGDAKEKSMHTQYLYRRKTKKIGVFRFELTICGQLSSIKNFFFRLNGLHFANGG